MRRLHTEVPPDVLRSSGSRVRLPVITTRLMFVAAISRRSLSLRRAVLAWSGEGTCGDGRSGRAEPRVHAKFADFRRSCDEGRSAVTKRRPRIGEASNRSGPCGVLPGNRPTEAGLAHQPRAAGA